MRTDSQIFLDGVQKSCSRQGRCFKTSLCFRFSWCYSCWCCLALLAICFQCCEWSFFLSFSYGWLRLLDILNQSAKIPLNLKIVSEILPALCLITNAIYPCYVAVWWCLCLGWSPHWIYHWSVRCHAGICCQLKKVLALLWCRAARITGLTRVDICQF